MPSYLVLCGGTGAHVGVAFLRLHTLGYALGFFRPEGGEGDRFMLLPHFFLVDQDSGDGSEGAPTAWQLVRRLLDHHPGRYRWLDLVGAQAGPNPQKATPLPIGPQQQWFKPPFNALARRFEVSKLLAVLTSRQQREIDYARGMMGSPAVGSMLFKLKEFDERGEGLNHDESYGQLLKAEGRMVVAGSGVGGTGASVGPTLAQKLANQAGNQVMAVMVLNWFSFEESEANDERRAKAQARNRVMRENANSALEFYGQALSRAVAAVPVGMPESAWIRREYTSDVGQPVRESFAHAVGALCAYRHFLRPSAFDAGLYAMGAVDRARLDGQTAVPGGTLQGLANQAATLAATLEAFQAALAHPQTGRIAPAIWDVVAAAADPVQVADLLKKEVAHYREQLAWMKDVLAVEGQVAGGLFTRESDIRQRLTQERESLELSPETPLEQVPSVLFHWAARWVSQRASLQNGLRPEAGRLNGVHWPDLKGEGINVAARENGDLTRIPDQDIFPVLEAFVDPQYLSPNGWPHPLAAADYFRHALENEKRSPVALRQLEILLVGMMAGRLELRPLDTADLVERELSLEYLAAQYRSERFPGLADHGLFDPAQGERLIGFSAPHTLFCPVPFMNNSEDNRQWQRLWSELSGSSDATPWSQAPAPVNWGDNDRAVRQIRAWIEQLKRLHQGELPAWCRVFEAYTGMVPVPFGTGPLVRVFWGSGGQPRQPLISINLPTGNEDGIWDPPPGTPELPEDALYQQLPGLLELRDAEDRVLFQRIEIERPDRIERGYGFWRDHLDQLKQMGRIFIFSHTRQGGVIIGSLQKGVVHQTLLSHAEILDRRTVAITSCTPLVQDPMPGSEVPAGDVLYPDLPLRSAYLDVVATPQGDRFLDLLRRGEVKAADLPRVQSSRDGQGNQVLRWNVPVRGRSLPLPIEIRIKGEPSHRAHWMVWPRFRARTGTGWRAYYIYESCTDSRLVCDVLYLASERQDGGLRLCHRMNERRQPGPYPLLWRVEGENREHAGGPPVALSARSVVGGDEGMYIVRLENLPSAATDLSMAIDFGTSHSVVAFQMPGERSQPVHWHPELEPGAKSQRLTLHLSEDSGHVRDKEIDGGLLAAGSWLPTYRERRADSFLPSEILLIQTMEQARSREVSTWVPLQDFTIPPLDISRSDVADVLITDFKWDTGSSTFRGREKELREHYLGLLVELSLAEVVQNYLHALPSRPINLTFTYPLRSTQNQVASLQESLRRVVLQGKASCGIDLQLKEGVGLYDESRAAQLRASTLGEVCLVGDLGGGTLDLFISGNGTGLKISEVADSVRLGGNLLLRQLAERGGFLPHDGGWANGGGARETEARLRAWMRSLGSSALFGVNAGDRPSMPALGLVGFSGAAQSEKARRLLDRYFRLVAEYMARQLVAYLVGQWFPQVDPRHHDQLKISVQLRGNGWRLRYQKESYVQTTQAIQDLIRRRVVELWPIAMQPENPYPVPQAERFWEKAERYSVPDPKVAPVKSVVGQAMSFDEVEDLWFTHTLVDLEVHRKNGELATVPWFTSVPFATGGSKNVQIREIHPGMVLSSQQSDQAVEVKSLDANLQGRINQGLQNEGVIEPDREDFRAPVAPLVWEAVFDSRDFWP